MWFYNLKRLCLLLMVFYMIGVSAAEPKVILDYDRAVFNPADGQMFNMPIVIRSVADTKIDIKVDIKVVLFSQIANNPIRTLMMKDLSVGKHSLVWDGRDDHGKIVPDEVYLPVVTVVDGLQQQIVLETRKYQPEIIDQLVVRLTATGDLRYQLPFPARVQFRVGLVEGPMLRSLSDWKPQNKGEHIVRWNGLDEDGLINLRTSERTLYMATAVLLPPYSILTIGNLSQKQNRKFTQKTTATDNMLSAYLPKASIQSAMRLQLEASSTLSVSVNLLTTQGNVLSVPLKEATFFVDNRFIGEARLSAVPLNWTWTPVNLSPGQHIFTVNLYSETGQVGVKSLLFQH